MYLEVILQAIYSIGWFRLSSSHTYVHHQTRTRAIFKYKFFVIIDHLSNPRNCYFETLPPAYLDGMCGFGVGTLFDVNGVYMSNHSLSRYSIYIYISKSTSFDLGGLIVGRIGMGVFEAGCEHFSIPPHKSRWTQNRKTSWASHTPLLLFLLY